jgi:hypothetical protein
MYCWKGNPFLLSENKRTVEKLSQKQGETQLLKHRVNTELEEIVKLAKENDASFLARFREVNPNIHQ